MAILQGIEKLRIICYPSPILKRTCAPVEEFTDNLRALAERMRVLMHAAEGVGLAAPQVGVLVRLFVCNHTGNPEDDSVFVNPRFAELSGAADAEEGCLSIPAVSVTMRRATNAVMEAQDLEGKPLTVEGADLQARVWQHEADHLDGRLITDHMSTADEIANRRALKILKEEYEAARSRQRKK